MTFRPRFRLSMLFVLAALVAGVSVWLRQAVVRDRNIRQLLAEDFASGTPDSDVSHYNTKILNFFCRNATYCDTIYDLNLETGKMNPELLQKYQHTDLGKSIDNLNIQSWDMPVLHRFTTVEGLEKRKLPLSMIIFWRNKFATIQQSTISFSHIVNDVEPQSVYRGSCRKLLLLWNVGHVEIAPQLKNAFNVVGTNFEIRGNIFEGSFQDMVKWMIADERDFNSIRHSNRYAESLAAEMDRP